ncbi:MAG: hypothetical protein HY271_19930 [Deltaproteobacteria bacterium]|nr:hypothetical protein [Deltaproteobacteria bacterium]
MKPLRVVATSVAVVWSVAAVSVHAENPGAKTWTFDTDALDKPPTGFSFGRTGEGSLGHWVVRTAKDAPSGAAVLAQVDTDATDYRFPVAVADSPSHRDLRLSVKCKPVAGRVDQACGLVFRYQDENNYYLTRANALEDNVNLYSVKDGRRKQFAGWTGKVAGQVWHALSVEATGDHFVVSWDATKVIEATDDTFSQPGKVGVWTKADSFTEFDDLTVAPVAEP